MSKKLTLGGKEDVRVYVELIAAAAEQTIASIRESTLAPLALLEAFKFEEFGTDPSNINRNLNLTEQINQTFTYLASFKVAEYVFNSQIINGHTPIAYPHKRIVGFSIIHLGSWRFFVRLDRSRKICTLAARYPS
jgi:hypothetical protein